jgi:hypothetical protein
MSNFNLKEVTLHNWDGINLEAGIEEKEEDITAIIKYWDHGDAFAVVVTKTEVYEYGWWLNRPGYYDYDELVEDGRLTDSRFIRLPMLRGEYDTHSNTSNEIYFAEKYLKPKKRFDFFSNEFVEISKSQPTNNQQVDFDYFLERIKSLYETGVIYHRDESNIKDIKQFLIHNNLNTEENLKKLDDLRIWYRIDAVDGIAGKQKLNFDDAIYGDSIEWIYYNKKLITKKFNKHGIKVKSNGYDEWGTDTFRLNLKQFKMEGE